jgi:hypothetical protein
MVALISDEKNRLVLSMVGENELRSRLTRSANYYQFNAKGHRSECSPPMDVVKDILALSPRSGRQNLRWCSTPCYRTFYAARAPFK